MNLHNSNYTTTTNPHPPTITGLSFPSLPQNNQEPLLVESFLSSTIRIATLNCRSLVKINEPSRRQDFIRFLRKQNPPLDIITLQETHASTTELKLILDNLFQTKQTCTITHSQRTFDPFNIITIYAPAHLAERQQFFSRIIEMPIMCSSEDISAVNFTSNTPSLPTRTIITGDFNYSIRDVSTTLTGSQALSYHQFRWNQELQSKFRNCLDSSTISPTFRRGQQMSTIDYMYSSSDLYSNKIKSNVEFISPTWTDHALLTFSFKFSSTHSGKGLWRANPTLVSNPRFLDSMNQEIDKTCSMFRPDLSPQLRWDRIKETVKKVARKTGRHHANWRKKQLDVLQLKRTSILNNLSLTPAVLQFKLPKGNRRIFTFLFERSITTRITKSFIPELLHPITSASCTSPTTLTDAAHSFYQRLYTPDDINLNATYLLAETIHDSSVLDDSQCEYLLSEFTEDNLLDAAKRSPPQSSPGIDGIPFHVLHNAAAIRVALQVYNDALLKSVFPPIWNKTCMILLPKKGDLTNLSNHRPISLINTDAKLFTRMLNARLMMYMNDLISPQQMGFMPSRFIGENGKTLQTVMSIAEHTSSKTIGLLLDQEKAYDRIHPTYLARMMNKFGIPSSIISSLCTLFFTTEIYIDINGHLSTPVRQRRGLRQGDPIVVF
ncbi:hypothetical protein INT47_005412 [Mucor saturninus]|uniref:Reverse transcriptase domain-containing protein n=1 Tax=Mucor saturninus TaxID=64648 RepID=A0A8H7UYF4_9FUNG|nr:hypothetical protein INT47_005412 [Mucor saturninus]